MKHFTRRLVGEKKRTLIEFLAAFHFVFTELRSGLNIGKKGN